MRFTIQGIIRDNNAGIPQGYSITNAVVVKVIGSGAASNNLLLQ